GFMLKIVTSNSAQTELWSVHEGLQLAKNLGISKLIVEVDASLVVRFLARPFEDDQIGTLILDCLKFINEGGFSSKRGKH
ncbi:hypothetical protein J1N35_012288, partial [Gossypium stocksii]